MQNYVIFTDVSTDIEEEFAKEHEVRFIGMHYTLGEENRFCEALENEDILKRFYDGQRNGDLTKTSQITPAVYREMFEPVVKEGKSILYIALSSGLSGTYQSAMLAANELMEEYADVKICPVDSLSATAGMGILVEAAVNNKESGMSVEENAEWLRSHTQKVHLWFKVDDLMYLKRGGRISAATAVVGTTLGIKPILKIDREGKLVNFEKKRGAKASLKALVKNYVNSFEGAENETVYIVHGDSFDEAEEVKKMILEKNPKAQIKCRMLSPIIGAHTGPGMIAVIHWGREREA